MTLEGSTTNRNCPRGRHFGSKSSRSVGSLRPEVALEHRGGTAVFEHQVQVLISGGVRRHEWRLAASLEVWKLPHLLGKGARPLLLTPLLCTCCRVLLSFRPWRLFSAVTSKFVCAHKPNASIFKRFVTNHLIKNWKILLLYKVSLKASLSENTFQRNSFHMIF